MGMKPRTKQWWYRTLQQLHLWIGLILCLPLVLLGLSGSILVFEKELEGMFSGRSTLVAEGEIKPAAAILGAAQRQAPKGTKPFMLQLPMEAGEPAIARFAQPMQEMPGRQRQQGQKADQPREKHNGGRRGGGFGRNAEVAIDPVSLDVIPQESSSGIFRVIMQFHSSLLLREYNGRSIVGWLGMAMLTLSISGIFLWWPKKGKWKAAFTIKRGAKGLRLHRDLHGATGIWSLLVLLAVSFSGIYLAFPQQTGTMVRTVFPGKDIRTVMQSTTVQPIKDIKPLEVSEVINLAEESVSDARLLMVRFPMFPNQPYTINFAPPGYSFGKPVIMVMVDQWKGQVINISDPREYTTGETISAWQRVIHGGYGLGLIWRILVFISGFLPLLFVITGTSMWLIKRRAKEKSFKFSGAVVNTA